MRNHSFFFDALNINENYWLVVSKKNRHVQIQRNLDTSFMSNLRLLQRLLLKMLYLTILPITLNLMNIKLVKQKVLPLSLAIFSIIIETLYLLFTILNLITFDSVGLGVNMILFSIFFIFINIIFLTNFLAKFSYFKFEYSRYDNLLSFLLCLLHCLVIFIVICFVNFILGGSINIKLFTQFDIVPFCL